MAKKSRDYFVFPARGSSGDINKATEDIKDTIYKSVAGLNVESNKSVSITQNGTVTITPSSGKDVMSAVTATVNVSGGSADLENNKTATIDVSIYTEPVEITPTAGKDGMKKATVTLSNIPQGEATLYKYSYSLDATAVDSILFKEEPQAGVPITGYFSIRTSYDGEDCTELLSGSFTFSNIDHNPYVLSSKPARYPYNQLFFKETI